MAASDVNNPNRFRPLPSAPHLRADLAIGTRCARNVIGHPRKVSRSAEACAAFYKHFNPQTDFITVEEHKTIAVPRAADRVANQSAHPWTNPQLV